MTSTHPGLWPWLLSLSLLAGCGLPARMAAPLREDALVARLSRGPRQTPLPRPLAAPSTPSQGPAWPAMPTAEPPPEACAPTVPRLDRFATVPSGRVGLTFDDGPHPLQTARVLDALEQHRLPAAFFVMGRHIHRGTYALVQRMEAAGHVIASHSYNHDIDMARHHARDADTVAYIRGQHEVTRVLIELALLAESGDDFDAMYRRVFAARPGPWLTARDLREHWRTYRERHASVLAERGFPTGRYAVRYTRPPGGGPYLTKTSPLRARYDRALREAGMINVLWHDESGDVHPTRHHDLTFLRANIRRTARRGGILLLHDYIAPGALWPALAELASSFEVVPLDELARDAFGCRSGAALPRIEPLLGRAADGERVGGLARHHLELGFGGVA